MSEFFSSPITLGGAVIVLAIFLAIALFSKNYIKVPPNRVAVFSGRGQTKVVRGGARLRIPGLERVDFMELEPFTITAITKDVYASDNVPVSVDCVGVVRFGSTDQAIQTAVQRFLTTPRDKIEQQVKEILAGIMRNIVAQMTIEALNGNRESFRTQVLEEAASAFGKLGMELDVLTIQNITDPNDYLKNLGRGRIAEVKSDADIRTAEAERDATVKAAAAKQAGQEATARSETAIAQAQRDRDLELAKISAQVESEQARADAAGKQAAAEADKDVVIARAETERSGVQAQIAVQELRAREAEQRLVADVIKPADAARQAAILTAEAERQASILKAQADAEAAKLAGEADADARKARAEAEKAEMLARAEGEQAKLLAEAAGQTALAEALNALSKEAAAQRVLPDLIAALPQMAAAIATPLGQIDRMVVIDGSGAGNSAGGGDTLTRIMSAVPIGLAQVIETVRATTGYDLQDLLTRAAAANHNGSPASPEVASLDGEASKR